MYSGRTIGHYEVREKLGHGGMGVVYRARDTKLDRDVALKFLSRDVSDDASAKHRFIREAKSASALDHPNICTIHDIAETDAGELYIVMAHYDGATLKYRMEHEEISVDRALGIIRQIGYALERAHEAGIIHRDIKPANVMVSSRDEVRLLDFGLAKLTSGVDITREGSTVGTAAYMSPEQARGDDVTPATDVWSLAAVSYELLAGKKPFGGAYEQAMIYGILNEDPPPLAEVRTQVPESIAGAVHRGLAKNPDDRFATAAGFVEALKPGPGPTGTAVALDVAAVPRTRLERTFRGRRAGVWAVTALLVLVATTAAVAGLFAGDGGEVALLENRFAVMPFRVLGSDEIAYLGEGLVSLISSKLDGAGNLQSTDPRAIIAVLKAKKLDPDDPLTGPSVARRLGAGRYITGDVVEAGGVLNISASLFDVASADQPISSVSREGPVAGVLDVIDGLATELLAGSLTGPDGRLQQLAARTSSSLPATKAFLVGEEHLREGRYRDAAEAYDEAVRLDSTFALAYFRKSLAGDWTDAPDRTTTAQRALDLSSTLSPREQTLVRTLRDQRIGLRRQAEQQYRTYLTAYPNDVEPLTQLAELLFHDYPRRGEPAEASRAPYERVLELEPGNLIAHVHLARLDALRGNDSLLATRSAFFAEHAVDGERRIEVDFLHAFVAQDSARQQLVLRAISEGPWYGGAYAALAALKFLHDPFVAVDVLGLQPVRESVVESMVPVAFAMQGRYADVVEFAQDVTRDGGSWATYNGFVLTTGFLRPTPEQIEVVLTRLRSATPDDIVATSFLPAHDDYTAEVAGLEKAWTEAMLLMDAGRVGEARAILEALRADAVVLPGLGSVREDALAGLEGLLLYQEGRPKDALATFRTIEFETPHFITWKPFGEQSRARFTHAVLEMENGELDRARGIFEGLLSSWSPFDGYYVPHAYERLGHIAEQEGREDDALALYDKVLWLWRDCDPVLLPMRDAVRGRVDAILRSRQTEPRSVGLSAASAQLPNLT